MRFQGTENDKLEIAAGTSRLAFHHNPVMLVGKEQGSWRTRHRTCAGETGKKVFRLKLVDDPTLNTEKRWSRSFNIRIENAGFANRAYREKCRIASTGRMQIVFDRDGSRHITRSGAVFGSPFFAVRLYHDPSLECPHPAETGLMMDQWEIPNLKLSSCRPAQSGSWMRRFSKMT